MASKIRIALSLSLTGRYAEMGRQAEAAVRLLVSDLNSGSGIRVAGERREIALECFDDVSDPVRCAEIYQALCSNDRTDLLLGPYSSRLARVAAPIADRAGIVMVNHGGADDDLYAHQYRMLVGVLSPASDYMTGFVHLLATLKLWRKRLAIVRSKSGFAQAVGEGIERACAKRRTRRKGVRIRIKFTGTFAPESTTASALVRALRRNRVNALVSAGGYRHDLEVMRTMSRTELSLPVLACVAAGITSFRRDLGEEAEGIVGPSQWEEHLSVDPEIGPAPHEFARRLRANNPGVACDYPAAQAYAAGLLTRAAIEDAGELRAEKVRDAFSALRTRTLFGDFAIHRVSGCQIGHRMLLVQWHGGEKVIIDPEPRLDPGSLEFPPGWRLILTSFQILKLKLGARAQEEESEHDEDEPG